MATIRWNSRIIEVFCEGERIACHMRSGNNHNRFITDPVHMPENHRAVAEWSPQRFICWAAKTGEQTKLYIATLLKHREHPEQAYRTCAGILRLASTVTVRHMELSCAEALASNIFSYKYFAKLLQRRCLAEPVMHENVRGKDYYQGGNHVE